MWKIQRVAQIVVYLTLSWRRSLYVPISIPICSEFFVILRHLMEATCIKAKNYNSANLSEAFANNENHEEKFICLIALIRWWNDAVIRY